MAAQLLAALLMAFTGWAGEANRNKRSADSRMLRKNPGKPGHSEGDGHPYGEEGIRTLGTVLPVRGFSKAVLSTTQPPLRQTNLSTVQGHRQYALFTNRGGEERKLPATTRTAIVE